ncbi:MAG: hypothetical protein NVSMB12_14020 [Acidimicrobiales bacterium]
MFRRAMVATLALLAGLVMAVTPAWAHEEINPKNLPTGQPTFFTLSAANEKKSNLVKVVLTAPKGIPVGATTAEPSGWDVAKTDTSLTWTAPSGGGVWPDHFAQWGFETDGADQPGSFAYTIELTYADGSHDPVMVPVTVTAASGANGAKGVVAHASQGRANAATAIGLLAIVLALVAIGLGRRRTSAADSPANDGQDW